MVHILLLLAQEVRGDSVQAVAGQLVVALQGSEPSVCAHDIAGGRAAQARHACSIWTLVPRMPSLVTRSYMLRQFLALRSTEAALEYFPGGRGSLRVEAPSQMRQITWRATSRSNWMRPSMEISLYSRVPYALLLNWASLIFRRLQAPHSKPQNMCRQAHLTCLPKQRIMQSCCVCCTAISTCSAAVSPASSVCPQRQQHILRQL